MKITYISIVLSTLVLVSCKKEGCTDPSATNYSENAKKDDGSCTYEKASYFIPTTYSFVDAAGNSTVDYPGQLDRLEQIRQIIAKMDLATTSTISGQDLKDMFANVNGNGNGNFNFTSTRQLKDKCFSLDQNLIESWMDSLAANSAFHAQTASQGQAGTLMVEGSLHLFSSQGIEYAERIEKALMGAVQMYQALNVYLDTQVPTADNSSLVSGQKYTAMEHYFDEAFGYFGVDKTFPSIIPGDLWGEYCNNQNPSIGCNALMMDNFLAGRAAIVNDDYTARDQAILNVQDTWEKITAYQAMAYLDEAMANVNNPGLLFHSLTEALGFVNNLKYAPDDTRNLSQTELAAILAKFNSNFWSVTLADLQDIKSDIDAKY